MPRLSPSRSHLPSLFLLLVLLPIIPASTTGKTGGDRLDGGGCPGPNRDATEDLLVYTPFQPYWFFDIPFRAKNDVNNCWVVADCLFETAGESRKQQFSAAALVMGLIPPTIKDIAWPERRVVYVTRQLHWVVEVLVLALGLVPQATGNATLTKEKGSQGAWVAERAWGRSRAQIKGFIGVFTATLLVCYGALVAMEVFSKRSALGCSVPVFIVTWHILALIPAGIHLLFNRHDGNDQGTRSADSADVPRIRDQGSSAAGDEGHRKDNVASAVQGASEYWPVQMAWGIYYIAGTLVFTSIMAVTVPELTLWVVLGLVTAGCSKVLALFLCLVCEDTDETTSSSGQSVVSSRDTGTASMSAGENRNSV
jgi:hypothetical protein